MENWKTLGSKAFVDADTQVDLRITSGVEHRDLASGAVTDRGAAAVLYLDSTQQIALQSVSLWRACLGLRLLSPHRLPLIQQLVQTHDDKYIALTQYGAALTADQVQQKSHQEKLLGRLVLMEASLALGLSSYLAQYILAYSTHSNGYDTVFLLNDVKRVHEWAVRTSLQSSSQLGRLSSVQGHLEGMARDLTENFVVQLLLCRESEHAGRTEVDATGKKIVFSRDVTVAMLLELQTHTLVCDGLKNVLNALLQRKLMSLSDDKAAAALALGNSRLSVNTSTASDVLQGVVEEAILELKVRLLEVKSLGEVLAVLYQLCVTPALSLNCMHAVQVTADGRNSSLYNLMANVGAAPSHLPREVSVGPSLFDELCSRLSPVLLSKTRVPNTDDQAALSRAVSDLLFLPVTGLDGIFAAITNTDTADEIESRLLNHVNISHSVVIHFLLTVFHLSSNASSGALVQALGTKLCNAVNIPLHLSRGLVALFLIDHDLDVLDAVREVCDPLVPVFVDDRMLVVTVKRLIRGGQTCAARNLLSHLCCIKHPFVETKLGVVSYAACVSTEESWQVKWFLLICSSCNS